MWVMFPLLGKLKQWRERLAFSSGLGSGGLSIIPMPLGAFFNGWAQAVSKNGYTLFSFQDSVI
jgi:hypothetical protein